MFMAKRRKTVGELEAEIDDLREEVDELSEENEELELQLSAIGDLVNGDYTEGEEDDDPDGCEDE
jgi:regulator of replication initiation timing